MRFAAVMATIVVAACGDDGGTIDGPRIDGPVDARIDANTGCGNDQFFTGEVIDFDSTPAAFMGVFDAALTLRGNPARTDQTAPNGRFELCIPDADSLVDFVGPASGATKYVDGVVVAPAALVGTANVMFSLRSFTLQRAQAFYTSLGETFDATRGHVMLYQSLDLDSFTLTGATN